MTERTLGEPQAEPAPNISTKLSIGLCPTVSNERVASHDARSFESIISSWMARNGILLTRIALGLVFLWFGTLKFFPGLSVAEDLAKRTLVRLTFSQVPPQVCLYVLAGWESAIGLGLLWGRFLRVTLILLFLQLPGTFLPLLFFPSETWKHIPYAPTLEGQYIIKNLVLISAGIIVGSTMRGGKIISDPNAARVGTRIEKLYSQFRGRFHKDPNIVSDKTARRRDTWFKGVPLRKSI